MASFKVRGGLRLKGEIIPQGAKNEALQILCAVLLSQEDIIVHKVPQIRDVIKLMDLLADMGVAIEKIDQESYKFNASRIDLGYLETADFLEKDRKSTRLNSSHVRI